MPIRVTCSCGQLMQVDNAYAGRVGKCPACRSSIRIPHASPAAVAPGEPPPAPIAVPIAVPIAAPVAAPAPAHPPVPPSASAPPGTPLSVDGVLQRHQSRRTKKTKDKRRTADSLWQPGEDVEYFGPDPASLDFFHDPPEEIGTIRSAHSSLTTLVKAHTVRERAVIAAMITAVIVSALAALFVSMQFNSPAPLPWIPVLVALLLFGVFVLFLTFVATSAVLRFQHQCAYVGDLGIAEYECRGGRHIVVRQQVLVFQNAAELHTTCVHHMEGVFYKSTEYSFTWLAPNGEAVFAVSGNHRSRKGDPPDTDIYHFGVSAERAWSAFLLDHVLDTLARGGSWEFRFANGPALHLCQNSLTVELDGRNIEFRPEHIARLRVEDGVFRLPEPGTKRFTNTRVHRFPFADLANGRLFLMVVERLFGVPAE